ncbi:long-chain-fatty-acid--CoA ligase [Lutimaribacter sp. EGI FJ00015]|uniref:Long-chain-fatty-acid--CoA ligase n=1 Tax=Lutimaribacter degradans TaxID=2945989 RepID=A0ACC5ZW30_9RHOB|nr:long-chain-fatty-acid--CoA ligase [Lutimaribacter sp. EGI FJ00013]MCM2562534.1 long-chain-fatty-acid--CoA ligase [Lutimaribacter sp. EGI FJ00013]MCO0613691.1 long-chain-fatty-acid--CoA ligase [Lutimaribacter sp. EGI FJ00015]MCO0636826.1 long-chain-fatty-acid--CoA ligase [Lutimaribacter sp. EGI FJ00014]
MMNRLHMQVWPDGVPETVTWPQGTLYDNLSNTAAKHGNRPALIYHGATLTYAQLDEQVQALAGYLQQKLEVDRGDRVLLYMQNSPQFVIGYYAILRADAVVVPINPMSRHAELEHLARDTGASVALAGQELLQHIAPIVDEGLISHVIAATYPDYAAPGRDIPLPGDLEALDAQEATGPGVIRWAAALESGARPAPHRAGADDLAVIPYSSGTTGQPKGCMHSHFTVNVTAWGGVAWNLSDETDVSLAVLPLFHVTGMQACMNGPIIVGGAIVLMTRWNRDVAATLIARHRVTRWRSISTMAIDLVNSPGAGQYDLSSLTAIGGGGAAMPEAVAKKLHDLTGLDYIEGYGLSETMAASHINPVTAPRRQCLGIPVFDVDSRVVNPDTLEELPQGEVGEIVTHGPQVFLGYWQRPDETERSFFELDGKRFFRTGDLGYIDPQGYFYMVDRVKRMINASGFKVWPAEVEALMHHHPDIAEACIIGTHDPRRGETVKAVVVPQDTARDRLTEQGVIDWCRSEMAAYKCPTMVEFTDALPKSGSGKVLWRELQERESRAKGAA